MVIDTSDLKLMSRLSPHVNAGYSARLSHVPHTANPEVGESGEAWIHGWGLADTDEFHAGRPSPVSLNALMDKALERADGASTSSPEFIHWPDDGLGVLQLHHTEVDWPPIPAFGPIHLGAGSPMGAAMDSALSAAFKRPTVQLEATMEFRDGPGMVKLMEQAIGEARPTDQEGFGAIDMRGAR